ncbi:MAG: zinc ribbon domain-containing protein [Chthoniobacterales bacterium]
MSNIICQSCGHENDLTRTFCQNCGIRLDAPAQPVESPQPVAVVATPVVVSEPAPRGRVGGAGKVQTSGKHKISTGGGMVVGLTSILATLLEVGLLAALSAALIQAWRIPNNVPPAAIPNQVIAKQFGIAMHAAIDSPYPREVSLDQAQLAQVNQYLATMVKLESTGSWFSEYLKFDRIFVTVGNDTFDTVMQESVAKHPFYIDVRYKLLKTGNVQSAVPIAGYIGRLPLHPRVLEYVQNTMAPAWAGIGADIQMLSTATQITLKPEQVQMSFPGGRK